MENNPKADKLQQVVKLIEDGVSVADFKEFVATILDFSKKLAGSVSDQIDAVRKELQGHKEDTLNRFDALSTSLKAQVNNAFVKDRVDEMRRDHDARMSAVDERAASLKDGERGPKGDKGKPGARGPKGDKGEPAPGIADLRKEVDQLKALIQRAAGSSTGGGVTNLRIQQAFKYILKTEKPSGLINGSNATYTVSQPIFAVMGMSLNGETIAQLPNYTLKGNSFTFSSPLPADYSGKDFEVKYI